MRVLVTGGLGFIGSNFIRYYLSKHEDGSVVNVDRLSYGANPVNLSDIDSGQRYSFMEADVAKIDLRHWIDKVEAVVNFAAESHVDRSIVDPSPFLESNVQGVLALLEAVRSTGRRTRMVQIGTDESYGDIAAGSFKETDLLKPSSPYAATKAAADMLCLSYHRTYAVDVVMTRCTNNFGPFQFPEKFIPKTIIRALRNLPVPVYGSGRQIRDWLYVLDHCEAIDLVLRKGRAGEIYNISAGNERENLSVVQSVFEIMNRDSSLIEHVEDRPGHDARYSLDSNKARRELGWVPRYSFKKSLRDTVEWYLKNQSWWGPLVNEKVLSREPWKEKW